MTVEPGLPDTGIVFVSAGTNQDIVCPGRIETVSSTLLATTLSPGGEFSEIRFSTVEHLMAALWGAGIDNAIVRLDGPEVPSMDGSALPFVQSFLQVGLVEQNAKRQYLIVTDNISVEAKNRSVALKPSTSFQISCRINHEHDMIPMGRFGV